MFYSVELLKLRKRGRIPRCWLAATLNKSLFKKYVTKQEVEQTDVVLSCIDIVEMMQCEDPSKKISLYLSAQLSYGVLTLHKNQVDNLLKECTNLLQQSIIGIDKPTKAGKPKALKSKNKEITEILTTSDVVPDINIDLGNVLDVSNMQDTNLLLDASNYQMPINFATPTFGALTNDEAIMFMTDFSEVRFRENLTRESIDLSVDQLAAHAMIPQPEMIEESIEQMIPQELLPETPSKRKSRKSHVETPSKKQRISEFDKETHSINLPDISADASHPAAVVNLPSLPQISNIEDVTDTSIIKRLKKASISLKFGEVAPSTSALPEGVSMAPILGEVSPSISALPLEHANIPVWEEAVAPMECESHVAAMPEIKEEVTMQTDVTIPMEVENEIPSSNKGKVKNKAKSKIKIDKSIEIDSAYLKACVRNVHIQTVESAERLQQILIRPSAEQYFTVPASMKLGQFFYRKDEELKYRKLLRKRKWGKCLIDALCFDFLFDHPLENDNEEFRELLDSINYDSEDPIRGGHSRTKSSKMSSVGLRTTETTNPSSKSDISDHTGVKGIPEKSLVQTPPRNEITEDMPLLSPKRPTVQFEEPTFEPSEIVHENININSSEKIKKTKERKSRKTEISKVSKEPPEESPDYVAHIPLAQRTEISINPETLPISDNEEIQKREETPELQYIFTKHDFLAECAGFFHRFKRAISFREVLPNNQYVRAEVTHCLNVAVALHVDGKLEIHQDNPEDIDIYIRECHGRKV